MNITPTKTSKPRCFACFATDPWRTCKQGSAKWIKSDIEGSLAEILGHKLDLPNPEVCESCLKKITDFATFKKVLEGNVSKLSRSLEQTKRQQQPSAAKKKIKTASSNTTAVPRNLFPQQLPQQADAPDPLATELPTVLPENGPLWNKGVQWDPRLQYKGTCREDAVTAVVSNNELLLGVEGRLLENLRASCVELTSRNKPSVLRSSRKVKILEEGNLVEDVVQEMQDRCPLLLDVLLTVATPERKHPSKDMYAMLALVYAMLMFNRSMQLSAMQRMMTIAAAKAGVCERYLALQNKLCITLCLQSKLNILDECAEHNNETTAKHLNRTKFCNVIGDNCDIAIQTGNESSDNHDKDLHYFGLLMAFPRLANTFERLPSQRPVVDKDTLLPDMFVITTLRERLQLLESYKVILGRLLAANIPALKWMATVVPQHIPHRFSEVMSQKSTLVPTELVLLNEAKTEHCVLILDEVVRQVRRMYTNAFGGTDELEKQTVPVLGDQLTRIRLQHAKPVRKHALNRVTKLEDIGAVMCTMWHNKQDLLDKAYATFYDENAAADEGTLYHFKLVLKRNHVNGNVKKNFKAHEELFLLVGQQYLVEQALEFLDMASAEDQPSGRRANIPANVANLSREKKRAAADQILMGILQHHDYGVFTWEDQRKSTINPPFPGAPAFEVVGKTPAGQLVLKPKVLEEDQLLSYGNNIAQWTLQLMHLNDTAKEGDLDRMVLGCKMNIPFFYSHSHLSKYFTENVNIVMKTGFTQSPQMQLRLLEASYVNPEGGIGKNIEADLAMEHSIRNRKDAIRTLGANKTENAIQRVTMAADTVARVTENFCRQAHVTPKSDRHTKTTSETDREKTRAELRNLRPFSFRSGRRFIRQRAVTHSPFGNINKPEMKSDLVRNIERSFIEQLPGWNGQHNQPPRPRFGREALPRPIN